MGKLIVAFNAAGVIVREEHYEEPTLLFDEMSSPQERSLPPCMGLTELGRFWSAGLAITMAHCLTWKFERRMLHERFDVLRGLDDVPRYSGALVEQFDDQGLPLSCYGKDGMLKE